MKKGSKYKVTSLKTQVTMDHICQLFKQIEILNLIVKFN